MTTLVDTNALIYAAGIRADNRRKPMATELLGQLRSDGCWLPGMGRSLVAKYRRSWTVFVPSVDALDVALGAVQDHQISFWDALFWTVAHENGVREIVTEGGLTGAVVGRVRFHNPFTDWTHADSGPARRRVVLCKRLSSDGSCDMP